MNERIKAHVESLFLGAPHTLQAADVKEELLANLQAKYEDLIAQGKTEDEAVQSAISGIGDIRSLLGEKPQFDAHTTKVKRHTSAVMTALGVTIIFFGVISAIVTDAIFSSTWLDFIPGVTMLATVAIAVALFIFSASISPKKYKKGDDTFVEEYKEKVTGNDRENRIRKAVSSTLWLAVTLFYFLISFATHAWHITWIIFIVGAIAQNIVSYAMGDPNGGKKLMGSTLWLTTVVIYLWLSFWTGAWAWTWLVFIAAALVQQIIRLVSLWRSEQ